MKAAAIAALTDLGLSRDDLIAETMRSPRQIERRAKARGLKIPTEFITSTSFRRLAGAASRTRTSRCPGRDEIVRSFSEALSSLPERRTEYERLSSILTTTTTVITTINLDRPDNANGRRGRRPRARGKYALASLTALATTLNAVDTTSVVGGSDGRCSLQEPGRRRHLGRSGRGGPSPKTAATGPSIPPPFKRGFVCFSDDNKCRRAASFGQPADARHHGAPRQGFCLAAAVGGQP